MGGVIIVLKIRKIKALMSKEERNLIIKSSICDENKKLKEVLSMFQDCIEKKDLSKIKELDNEVYNIIKTRDAVEEMRDTASLEWMQYSYEGKKFVPCELCGNTRSEEKFIIVNRINNNRLSLGSKCIFKFPKMDTKLHGIPITKISRLSKSNHEKLKRIVKFNDLFGSAIDIFDDWKNKYNQFNIIFPKSYDIDYIKIIKQGKEIYNLFINDKIDYDEMKSNFQASIDNFEYLYKNCIKFYNDKKDYKYGCTREIAKLLKDNGYNSTLNYIQDNESITRDIAKYVYHIEFVQRFKDDIQNGFKKYNLTLKSLDNQFVSFSYKYGNFEPIALESSLKDFTFNFSDMFYGINNFNQNYIFKGLIIKNDYENVYNFSGILENVLKSGYNFYIDEKLYDEQRIELRKIGLNKYAIINLKYILNNFTEILYQDKINSRAILLNYINNITWINVSDKEKYDIGNISEKWAK